VTNAKVEDVAATATEPTWLTELRIELIDFCAKVTGRIEPTVVHARDDALSGVMEIGS
jgi:hypothetical protein